MADQELPRGIFGNHADAYYQAGLQVIPLVRYDKKPMTNDWSRFANEKVSEKQQIEWITGSPDANIGLVLGPASGLTAIDIDTDKPEIYEAIMSVLPFSPWIRKGRKGALLLFKFTGVKTCRIKNLSNETIVEILSAKTQCVIPPSIHPQTRAPYTENVPLLSILDRILPLPENIEELLRTAVKNAGEELSHSGWSKVTDYVPAGSRDTTLTEMAGLFAYAILRGERTLKEAIGMLQSYSAEFVEKVAGDQMDVNKHVSNMIKFLHRDVLERGKVLPPDWNKGYTQEELTAMGVTLGVEETEWKFEELRLFLQDKFEASSNPQERSAAVEDALKKIAGSKQLSKIDEERILIYVRDVSDLKIPLSTLRGRVRELRAGDISGTDHSEIARALLKDLEATNLIRYHGDRFWKWAGAHWIEFDRQLIFARLSQDYGHLPACRKANDIAGIVKVMSFLCEQGICKQPVVGVNFANGFLTQQLKLIPHNPDFGMTYVMSFRYTPEDAGKFPLFARFMSDCWGKDSDYQEKMLALQQAMCVTLFGLGPKFQRVVLLHGAPRSGKTQMLRIVEMLVPGEAKSFVPPNKWSDKFLPTMMMGKLLNICGELSSKHQIDGQQFKDIVDGSELHGQYKGQQIFKFKPTVTHWFASNHIPKSEDTSAGFIRRWLFLTFAHPVKDSNVVTDLGDLISAQEREAIVAWAAQALPELLQKQHFFLPASHKTIVADFSNLNNSVRFFLTESGRVRVVTKGETLPTVSEMTLYNAYWSFCSGAGGSRPVSNTVFRQMMRELSSEMDFQLKVKPGPQGSSEAVYHGLEMGRAVETV